MTSRVRSLAVVLVVAIAIVVSVVIFAANRGFAPDIVPMREQSADAPRASRQSAHPDRPAPLPAEPGQALREQSLDVAESNRGDSGARQLHVHVVGGEQALPMPLPLPVELLFGQGGQLQTIAMFANRDGTASWPSAQDAGRPWFADFAFPTSSGTGQRLLAEDDEVRLQMPPTCVLELLVVEFDGQPTGDVLTVEVRSTETVWPMNRWRSVRMVGGRAAMLAEAAGERIEVRVTTATGRSAQATFFAAKVVGERVPCVVPLPPTGGAEVVLGGLTGDGWIVTAHSSRGERLPAHRLPGAQHRYVIFWRLPSLTVSMQWLIFATRTSDAAEVYWGYTDQHQNAPMQAGQQLAVGRCVDANGDGLAGYHVELQVQESGLVLTSVLTGGDGSFQLVGPAEAEWPLVAVLREARDGKPEPEPLSLPLSLPHHGALTFRIDR